MNIQRRLEKVEFELKANQAPEFIVVEDCEEYLRASLQGPGKIVVTESELERKRRLIERAKVQGLRK